MNVSQERHARPARTRPGGPGPRLFAVAVGILVAASLVQSIVAGV